MAYDHKQIETKWLDVWAASELFQNSTASQGKTDKEKLYLLFAFAYPSGSGLHVGHVESKTALDILARYYRMQGKQVFFPVGWDAFGLPAENYAVKTGVHPAITTKNAIKTFEQQVRRIGISYDWANELATNHPGYYKWTQWIFLQLYNKGLAYKGIGMVNWCPKDQTVLANEQVVNGKCERCGTAVVQKELEQWYFKITQYQDELISGLDKVDWPEATKLQQVNWIGRKKGVEVQFKIKGIEANPDFTDKNILKCFTTRIDTIYGVTFLVVSPETIIDLKGRGYIPNKKVEDYYNIAMHKTEEERQIGEKDKTGENTGLIAINPVNGNEVPIYVADYVLSGYGTGCVMGVPAHDDRDKAFAQKYELPIIPVLNEQNKLINSSVYDGLDWQDAQEKIVATFRNVMGKKTTYKLRDWLISRQRYWGAPIPIVYDPEGKAHPVKQEHLPWLLPTDVDFKPTGESPLKSSKEFIERTERLYGKGWRPEFDTMDTFVDSSWYYLRYTDARNENEFASRTQLDKWLPVDFYMIGPEHIVLHLLYSRFLTKFLRDEGYLSFDEPFMKMRHQGMILGPDHRKMSKSKGNVIDPDEVINQYGADTLRMYEMFMGPIGDDKPWSTTSVVGIARFLNRVWELAERSEDSPPAGETGKIGSLEVQRALHQTLKKVTEDIPLLKFNTAIASLMEFVNVWEKTGKIGKDDLKIVIRMFAPFAPFMSEELWEKVSQEDGPPAGEAGKIGRLEENNSVHLQPWPTYNPQLVQGSEYLIVVQINGKLRHTFTVPTTAIPTQAELEVQLKVEPKVAKWLMGKEIKKVIYIPPTPNRQGMVNWVVG